VTGKKPLITYPALKTTELGVPIYENLVIGNFLYALGLKIGARQHDYLAPDLTVNLIQQTPIDFVLGDVLLVGPRAVALLEFKREANREGHRKEQSKLLKIETVLEHPKFEKLRDTSRQIHFYVETSDILEEGFESRVLPYLELRTDERKSKLEELIDNLAFRARSAPALTEMDRKACQRYLKLVCRCQGRNGHSYHASPGLLVGVDGDGRIRSATVDDIRHLQNTFAAIEAFQNKLARENTLKIAEAIRLGQVPSISRTQRQGLTL
jgi:hypothetical protein